MFDLEELIRQSKGWTLIADRVELEADEEKIEDQLIIAKAAHRKVLEQLRVLNAVDRMWSSVVKHVIDNPEEDEVVVKLTSDGDPKAYMKAVADKFRKYERIKSEFYDVDYEEEKGTTNIVFGHGADNQFTIKATIKLRRQ